MIRPQYHGRHTPDGFLVWDVRKLLEKAAELPAVEIKLSTIAEFDENWWYQSDDDIPTCRSIADHFKLMESTDLQYPILLCAEGRLMDGMHRVMKAYCEGRTSISTRRFVTTPPPDYVDVDLAQLSYDN
ncbi:MAG: hypothetical protein ABJM29_01260 [Rhizobiaceae bacterium]